MITVKNVIDYIKFNEKEFDICGTREITNKKLVICLTLKPDTGFNFRGNIVSIYRFDKNNYVFGRNEVDPYIIFSDEISEQEADELYFLFKSIKNRIIKGEIEKEILSI